MFADGKMERLGLFSTISWNSTVRNGAPPHPFSQRGNFNCRLLTAVCGMLIQLVGWSISSVTWCFPGVRVDGVFGVDVVRGEIFS